MAQSSEPLHDAGTIRAAVAESVGSVVVTDMHTHLYAPEFGALNLWGVDSLLNYHYLIAELFRVSPVRYRDFWGMSQTEQADMIWQELFVRRPPISEATQGVVRVLTSLGLDPCAPDLKQARAFYAQQDAEWFAERVLDAAGIGSLVMTNDPFDQSEASVWMAGPNRNPRYRAALRLDHMLVRWPEACTQLAEQGYRVTEAIEEPTFSEARRFLTEWVARMSPLYMAVSLPAEFTFPDDTPMTRLLRGVVLPSCLEHGLPLALMVGVRRQVNPSLRLAGDGVAKADVSSVERLAAEYPQVRFLITFLSRENQHELCVSARKFRNLLPFGCWWFLNNPSIVSEITRERLEMLGATFIAQHSDARVLDQVLYKWPASRKVVGEALADTYVSLSEAGRPVTRSDIASDVDRLFSANFAAWFGSR